MMSCVSPQSSSHLPIQKHFHQTPTRLAAGGWRGLEAVLDGPTFKLFMVLVKCEAQPQFAQQPGVHQFSDQSYIIMLFAMSPCTLQ